MRSIRCMQENAGQEQRFVSVADPQYAVTNSSPSQLLSVVEFCLSLNNDPQCC